MVYPKDLDLVLVNPGGRVRTYQSTFERNNLLSANHKTVLLVIPVHDRPQEFISLLSSLNRLRLDHLELTVVTIDDGSPQPIADAVKVELENADLILHRHEVPHGPGYCRNLGAQALDSDYLWFLDSDTEIINRDTLVNMVKILAADQRLAGVGGVMESFAGQVKVRELEILPNFNFLYRSFLPANYNGAYVDGLGTCNLLIRREAFAAIQGFWEKLTRDEDNDLCLTLQRLGYRFYQDPGTLVWHKSSKTGRQSGVFAGLFRDQRLYLSDLLENRLHLVAKHSPGRLLILPFLDLFLAPAIMYRLKTGVYASDRFGLVFSKHARRRLITFVMWKNMQCYLKGFLLFFRSLLRLPPPMQKNRTQ